MRTGKILASKLESLERRASARIEVADRMGNERTRRSLKQLAKPNSVSGTLGKAGAVLLLSPDPLSDIPAIAMIGTSYIMKRREPLSVSSAVAEAGKTLRELKSIL